MNRANNRTSIDVRSCNTEAPTVEPTATRCPPQWANNNATAPRCPHTTNASDVTRIPGLRPTSCGKSPVEGTAQRFVTL